MAGLLVLGLALVPTGLSAHEIEREYTTSTTPGISLVWCPFGGDGIEDTGIVPCIGGVQFSADENDGEDPQEATFADVSGGAVDFTVGQDFDENNIVCEEGEPCVAKCGTSAVLDGSDPDGSGVAFSSEYGIATFVRLWAPECPDTVATSGTITVSW